MVENNLYRWKRSIISYKGMNSDIVQEHVPFRQYSRAPEPTIYNREILQFYSIEIETCCFCFRSRDVYDDVW